MPQQHPGVPPGHNMAPGMVHNPSQPGSQPGGLPPHLAQQMGVSAPGGQVNPSALMGGMPGGPNAHAMQHLNPQVHSQMYAQGTPMNNCELRSCDSFLPRPSLTVARRCRPADATPKACRDPATTTAGYHGSTDVPDAAAWGRPHGSRQSIHAPTTNSPVAGSAGKTDSSALTTATGRWKPPSLFCGSRCAKRQYVEPTTTAAGKTRMSHEATLLRGSHAARIRHRS